MSTIVSGFNLAATLAQLAQTAARPSFELQFHLAQNAAIDRLNEKIVEFQDSNFGQGKTALLRVKVARLERTLGEARDYKDLVNNNRLLVTESLSELSELRDLADASTTSEFEDKRSELLLTLDKLHTLTASPLGVSDGLSSTKADSIAAIEGIVTNDFASAADITAAQDTIDAVTSDLTASLTIIQLNKESASSLIKSADRGLSEARLRIDDIVVAERKKNIDAIQELEAQTATILSTISLAFEASQFLTQYVDQNVVQTQEIDPGSVLNLFV